MNWSRGLWRGWAVISLFWISSAHGESAEVSEDISFERYQKQCLMLPDNMEKIKRCLRLAQDKKVGGQYISAVYNMVGMVYGARLHDYDAAIVYQKMAIDAYPTKPPPITDKRYASMTMISYFAQHSYHYEWLGRFQMMKSLLTQSSNIDVAFHFLQAAASSFKTATTVYQRKHSAYANRAKALDRLCQESEANSSLEQAIDIASQMQDYDAVNEYKGIILGYCVQEYRGKN